jgi:hypothetical protein
LPHAALVEGQKVEMPGQGAEKPGLGPAEVTPGTADEKQLFPRTGALEKEGVAPQIDKWHDETVLLKYYYNSVPENGNPVIVVTAICDQKAAENRAFFLDRNLCSDNFFSQEEGPPIGVCVWVGLRTLR